MANWICRYVTLGMDQRYPAVVLTFDAPTAELVRHNYAKIVTQADSPAVIHVRLCCACAYLCCVCAVSVLCLLCLCMSVLCLCCACAVPVHVCAVSVLCLIHISPIKHSLKVPGGRVFSPCLFSFGILAPAWKLPKWQL